MKKFGIFVLILGFLFTWIGVCEVCAKAVGDSYDPYDSSDSEAIAVWNPSSFTKPSASQPAPTDGGTPPTPPAGPAAGTPQTVFTTGDVQFYPSSAVSGGFNFSGPGTPLNPGTQVTQTGETSLQFTTGSAGGLFGVGINNVTPVQLTDPQTGQTTAGYIVSAAWNKGVTTTNPFGKK